LTAQILLAGVLLLAPLIYRDALPAVRFSTIVPMPVLPPPPERPREDKPTSVPRQGGLSAPTPFRPRPRISVSVSQDSTIINLDAPVLTIASVDAISVLPTDVPALPSVVPPAAAKPAVREPDKPVPVSGGVQAGKLIKQVIPTYPQLAIRMRVSGTVRLLGIIGKDGKVQSLQLLSGNPLLIRAALDAVRQWVYSPTVLSGNAVEVEAPIDVIFTLSR
jgi:protein TonB